MNPKKSVTSNRLSMDIRNVGAEFGKMEKDENAGGQATIRQEIFASVVREVAVNSKAKNAQNIAIKNICIRFNNNGDIKEGGAIVKHYLAIATDGLPFVDEDYLLSALQMHRETDGSGVLGSGTKAAAYYAGYRNFDEVELLIFSKKDKKGKDAVVGRMTHNTKNDGTYICEIYEADQYAAFFSKYFDEFEQMNNLFLIRYQWVEKTRSSDCGLCSAEGMSLLSRVSYDINTFKTVRFAAGKIYGHFNSVMSYASGHTYMRDMVKASTYDKSQTLCEFKTKLENMNIDGYVFDVRFQAKHYPNINYGPKDIFAINAVRGEDGKIEYACGDFVRTSPGPFTIFIGGDFSIRTVEADRIKRDPFLCLPHNHGINNKLGIPHTMTHIVRTNVERLRERFEAVEKFAQRYKGKKDIKSNDFDQRTFVEHNPKTVYEIYLIPKAKTDNSPLEITSLFKWKRNSAVFFYRQLLSNCAEEILKKAEAGQLPDFIKFRDEIKKTFPPSEVSLPQVYNIKTSLDRIKLFSAETVGGCEVDVRLNKIDVPFVGGKSFRVFAFNDDLGFLHQELKIDDELGVYVHKTAQKSNGKTVYKLKIDAIELYKENDLKVPQNKREMLALLEKGWKVATPKKTVNCVVDDQEYRLAIDIEYPTLYEKPEKEDKHKARTLSGSGAGILSPATNEDEIDRLEQLGKRRRNRIGTDVFEDFGRPELVLRVNGPSYMLNLQNECIQTMIPKLDVSHHKDFRIWFGALASELDQIKTCMRQITATFTGARKADLADLYGDDVESYVLNAHARSWIRFNRNFRANNLFHKRIDNVMEEEAATPDSDK